MADQQPASPVPIAPPVPNPADPTNSVAGPYVPSHIQTGIGGSMPISNEMNTDQRLNMIFNPSLTAASVPGPKTFADFANQGQNPLPPGMSLKDAFFSSDPRIKAAASSIMNANDQADPFTRTGGGDSINTPFDQASRFDNKLGFSPLRNNESIYAENQGFFPAMGNSLVNLVGKTAAYAAQNVGLVGGAVPAALTGNITNMTDNFLTRAGDWLKDKVSEDFPVYKSDKYTNGNIFQKLGTLGWWADDAMDRVALTAAMFLPIIGEMNGISLAGSIGADGVATGLGAKAIQAVAEGEGGFSTVMKRFLPGLAAEAADGTVNAGFSPAFKNYVGTLSRAEQGAWNVLGQSGLNAKETYDAILKGTGDKDKAAAGAVKSFWETVPLSMGNTLIELPQMMSTTNTAKSLLSKIVDKDTGALINPATLEGPSVLKTIGKSLITGLEHGQNESMQVAVSRYNEESAEGKDTRGILPGIFGDFMDNINDPNGQNNIALGTIQGILTTLGGRVLAKVNPNSKDYQEKRQLTSLYNIINQAQTERRFTNGDFAARNDDGTIKIDGNGKVVPDQQKMAAAGVSLAGLQQNLENKQEAIAKGNYLSAAFADHQSLTGLAQAYFQDPGGDTHLINLLKTEAREAGKNPDRINDLDAQGNEITPEQQLNRNIEMVKKLKRAYDVIDNQHAGIMSLGIDPTNKIQVDKAKEFLANKKNAQYHEAAHQLFITSQLKENQGAMEALGLEPDERREYDKDGYIDGPVNEKEERFNDLHFDNLRLQASLEQSKNDYKKIIDKEELRKAFKEDLAAKQQVAQKAANKPVVQQPTPEPETGLDEGGVKPTPVPTPTPTPAPAPTDITAQPPVAAAADTSEKALSGEGQPAQHTYEENPLKFDYRPDDGGRFAIFNPDNDHVATAETEADAIQQVNALNQKYGLPASEFVTKDPQGNRTGRYDTEDEAKAATDEANRPPAEPESEVTPGGQEPEQAETDNAEHIEDVQRDVQEERGEYGKMIINSFSIASKAQNYDKENGIAIKDDLGRPSFNSGQDTIIDFGMIVPGDSVFLREVSPDAPLTDNEKAVIRIYTKDRNGETLLGYVHTLEGARRLLTQNVDMETELQKLSDLRSAIIASNGGEFEAKVTKTGFGFPNKGDARGYKSIDEATGNDSKAVLAIKRSNSFIGERGTTFATRFGARIREGATVLMLPNNVDGQEVLIPVYVAKKAVSTDPKIRDIVHRGITEYLSTGDEKALNAARDYIYITKAGSIAIGLTNNGLFLNPNGQLIFRGQDITSLGVDELMTRLQVNVNGNKLTDAKYVAGLRKSPAIQTTFFSRNRSDTNNRSYFHQHTIQFSLTTQPTTHGKVQQIEHPEDLEQKQSVQYQGEGQAGLQGRGQRSDADSSGVRAEGQKVSPADLIRQQGNIVPTDLVEGETRIHPVSFLRTMNMGDDEGKPETDEAKKRFAEQFAAGDVKIGRSGQTADEFKTQVIPGMAQVLAQAPSNTVVMTHSSVLKAIRIWDTLGRPPLADILKGGKLFDRYSELYNKEETKNGDIEPLQGKNGTVYVVRHGQTEDNRKGNFRSKETPLTSKGIQQAIDAGKELAKLTGQQVPLIISSDLPRTLKSSEYLQAEVNANAAQARLDQLNRDLQQDLENEGFIMDDISGVHDISEAAVAQVAAQPSSLLIPGFNAFVQEDAINSISQLLLSEDDDNKGMGDALFGDVKLNKDRAKELLASKLAEYDEKVVKYQPLINQGNVQALRFQSIAKNLKLAVDNYDAVHKLATDRLEKIGLHPDEQGYYTAADNDDDFLRYDDDSEYTRNNYDSISRLVRQFISFNSEKIEKDGKVGNRLNNLGLPTVVQPAVVYTKIINWLSEKYFPPTFEGFMDMVDHLADIPDPTIQDIASRLRNSQNAQLKFQFFTNMSKFKTDHLQQLITIRDNDIFARNIEANRNQLSLVVADQLAQEFLDNSKVLDITNDEFGNPIYRVNKEQVQPYLNEFMTMSRSRDSYGTKKDQDGQPTGVKFLRTETADKMYQILKDLGFGFSKQTFVRSVSNRTSDNPKGDAQQGIANLFTGGNKILRNMAEGEQQSQERDLHNPFIINPTEMQAIARVESAYRNIDQTDSFRSNGKSYYPFTRLSFVKSIFQQINEYAQTGQLTPLLKTFTQDPFKSSSRFLQKARIDRTFSPSLQFARGTRETGSRGMNQEVKDMNDKDFVTSKIFAFQNSGNKDGLFFSDTYSDKTTRFQIKTAKEDVKVEFNAQNQAKIDDATLNLFYNYFKGELRRVNLIREHNSELPDDLRISGLHDLKGKEGIGKYFVIFNTLNKDFLDHNTAKLIYADDGSVKQDAEAEAAIKAVINQNLIQLVNRYQVKLEKYGMFSDAEGRYSAKGINDTQYYGKMAVKFDEFLDEHKKAFIITADYVVNSALNSLEMLTLTGDPAQSPKVTVGGDGRIKLGTSIRKTLTEVSKRNASLNAPFDQGISIQAQYNVGFLRDLKINSDQLEEYKKLLPSQKDAVEAAYKNGDMTDAEEVTTVRQHLVNLLSLGRISPVEYIQGLAHFDPEDFDKNKRTLAGVLQQLGITYTLDKDKIRQDTKDKDMTGLLQVFKPVQRYSRWDENLGMLIETYIKTSSFPLVPDLVKGTDFEEVLRQMQDKGIDRLDFSSGVKQGLINPQSVYDNEGKINDNLFTTNVVTMPAAAWGEQVENPEKEELKVTEGSQQQRLIFVDLPDDAKLTYKGQRISGKDLREKYVNDHKTIFQTKKDELFRELGVHSADGVNSFTTLKHLSDILQREGLDRDYDRNTLLSLGMNKSGQFEVPLTFLPNASEIQQLISAVISNRILKNKLPGNSLIQGSEMVIKTNGKLKVFDDIRKARASTPSGEWPLSGWSSDEIEEEREAQRQENEGYGNNSRGIIWTKPEYRSISKLKYIRTENGEVKPAQIILPFYFKTEEGKSVRLSDFTNKNGDFDLSKIDPELLEINGFRIPYAGPNSGMWFEVVGYLPETMGSLVIVPAEVAAQMGADYDVDKLFTYVLNHTVGDNGIRVDASTPQKAAENDIIQAHKSIYLNKDRLAKTVEPTSTDELDGAVKRNLPKASTDVTQIYDPAHQDEVWLSNRAGQLGVGISANYNTFHALAQQAHLFVKGPGVKLLDKNGKVYNETDNAGEKNNSITSDPDEQLYWWTDGKDAQDSLTDNSVSRLDRVNTFPNPYTNETRPIGSVINAWLQASVDNAKLQLLGAAGINKSNFNVALTIVLHGFDSDWAIPFINQPILKEYYETIQGLNDKFNKDFSLDRKGNAIDKLFDKYIAKLGLTKDEEARYDTTIYNAVSHSQLVDGVTQNFDSMSKDDVTTQLEVLKQFINLDKIGATMSGISSDTKVEVRGLSKSFAEINQQAKDIDTLGTSVVGGTERLAKDTVSGVYLDVPGMVDDLFNHPDNPLFAYSTPVYQYMGSSVQALTGRNMNAEALDNVYKELKQFVYTHPGIGLHSPENPISSVKDNLLVKGSLANSLQDMKAKYPNSILLSQLSVQQKKRGNDPGILTMQKAADEIATQVKQEWFDFFKSEDPALVTFINQLTTYSLLFASKEYGASNMIKLIPFEVLKGIGFGDRLNEMNRHLGSDNIGEYRNFLRQYIQHNPDQAQFISNRNLPRSTQYQPGLDGKPTTIPSQFTMPDPTLDFLNRNPALKNVTVPIDRDTFGYRKYVRTFANEAIGSTLYELQDDERTYRRIDTLGNQYINEYDFTNPDARTIFPLRQAVQESNQVAPNPPSAEDNPNPTTDDVTKVYTKGATVNDLLDTIQLRNGNNIDPVSQLYYQLAAALAGNADYKVEFSDTRGTRGTTFHNDQKVVINPKEIERIAADLKVPYEQALQQTILHEAIHNATDRYMRTQDDLPTNRQSAEFQQVTKIWNQYRKNLVEGGGSTYVRGIQDTFLQAELLKALYERFAANKNGYGSYQADLKTVFSDWDRVKGNYQELLSVIHDMQEGMKEAHGVHGIGKDANFELVKKVGGLYTPVDTDRVAQIVDYLDKKFTKDTAASMKAKYYAYVDPVEFNTMAMTSPEFMEHLNGVQGSGENQTFWQKFKDIIKKIVSSFKGNSLLNDAVNAVLNIAKVSAQNRAEKAEENDDTPPWEESPPSPAEVKPVVPTEPTITNEQSFTFRDGLTIPTPGMVLNPQQREGLQKMADAVEAWKSGKGDNLFMLSGFAGTGKSSTTKYLVQYLNKKYRGAIQFKLSTPTHKANKVLGKFFRGTINDDPTTSKAILGYKAERDPVTNKFNFVLDERKNKIPANGVLIMDEASFIGQKEYSDILAAAAQKRAMVIFMGDIAQIPSPDGSNKVSPAFGIKGKEQLTQVMRQADGNPLAPIYDHVRNNLLVNDFGKLFPHKTNINSKGEGIEFIPGTYQDTGKLLKAAIPAFQSPEFAINKMAAKMVAYGNPTVEMYNREIRHAILKDASEDFQIGELLMGYEQKQQEPAVQNGQDYVITSRNYVADKVTQGHNISGYELGLKEADDDRRSSNTFILNPKDITNQPFLQHYVTLLEELKQARGADYYRVQEMVSELEEQALVPETIYSYQGKVYTNSMLRQEFPNLFKFDEATNQRPIDKMTSVAKNIDYGYAVTAHKVQGSTYKQVFIDENNLEFDKRIINDTNNQPFAYERNSLLYVALSRPTTKATVLSRHAIDDTNTHEASQKELQENRSVTEASKAPAGPTLNVSESAVDKIRKGNKTMMNTRVIVSEGTYFLKDGTKVQVSYNGEAAVVKSAKQVWISLDPDEPDAEFTKMGLDEYARKEGFANWADFEKNAKGSADFANGDEVRYSYNIKTLGKAHDISDTIEQLKKDNLLKKNC